MTAQRSRTLTRPVDTQETHRADDWREDAACRTGVYPDEWYPLHPDQPDAYDTARTICQGCPVRAACLETAMTAEGALSAQSRHGMWGAKTPAERAALARKERRRVGTKPIKHGVPSGVRAHERRGEPPCGLCRAARNADLVRRRAERKATT